MIATIAAQQSRRSLRAYGNIHSAIFAIVATVIAELEKFLSLGSTVATIAKIAECMFPYARKDRSDRCDRCAAIVAIIWKPGFNRFVITRINEVNVSSFVKCPGVFQIPAASNEQLVFRLSCRKF